MHAVVFSVLIFMSSRHQAPSESRMIRERRQVEDGKVRKEEAIPAVC